MSKVGSYGYSGNGSVNFGTTITANSIYSTTATVSGGWEYITTCPNCNKLIDYDSEEYIMVRTPRTLTTSEEMVLWHVGCYGDHLVDLDAQMVKIFAELRADIDGHIRLEPDQSFL